jgi:hypothetical protein
MPKTATREAALFALLADAGPTVSVPLAGRCMGLHRATAYEKAARGELGVTVLRLGRTLRVPTAELRRVLGLGERDEGGSAARATYTAAPTAKPHDCAQGNDHPRCKSSPSLAVPI